MYVERDSLQSRTLLPQAADKTRYMPSDALFDPLCLHVDQPSIDGLDPQFGSPLDPRLLP